MADKPLIKFAFDFKFNDNLDTCKNITFLTRTEKSTLKEYLERVIPLEPEKLPAVKFVKHVINTIACHLRSAKSLLKSTIS